MTYGHMSTSQLEALAANDDEDAQDELEMRAHDIEDPSSGLGLHSPS